MVALSRQGRAGPSGSSGSIQKGSGTKSVTGADPQTLHRTESQLRFEKQQRTARARDGKAPWRGPGCDHTFKELFYTKTSLQIQQYLIILFYVEAIIIHQKQILEGN